MIFSVEKFFNQTENAQLSYHKLPDVYKNHINYYDAFIF